MVVSFSLAADVIDAVTVFTESVVEDSALAWLESLGYAVKHLPAPQNETTRQASGPEIGPGKLLSERTATRAKNATVQLGKLGPGNCFREGNSWVLSYRCG